MNLPGRDLGAVSNAQAGPVYIVATAVALPNRPVSNDEMEDVLGRSHGVSSAAKRVILRNNGIHYRYYAIDPETGRVTHTNAQLTAEAVRALAVSSGFNLSKLECLACGTSSPDQWIPSHALMVHGELTGPPCEVVSTAGVCCSGMAALKYAWMSVAAGLAGNAVATGSEVSSHVLRSSYFEDVQEVVADGNSEGKRLLAFERGFLRWMLSDGAGAFLLRRTPPARGVSLRIDWIEYVSYAGEMETCMYWGATKRADGGLDGWRSEWRPEAFAVTQDVRLLDKHVVEVCVGRALSRCLQRQRLDPPAVDWFLPHISSEYFRPVLKEHLEKMGFPIPESRWFTNLSTKGNTGAAAMYIILDELRASGRIAPGQRILCFIPESARFSACWMLLTAVAPRE